MPRQLTHEGQGTWPAGGSEVIGSWRTSVPKLYQIWKYLSGRTTRYPTGCQNNREDIEFHPCTLKLFPGPWSSQAESGALRSSVRRNVAPASQRLWHKTYALVESPIYPLPAPPACPPCAYLEVFTMLSASLSPASRDVYFCMIPYISVKTSRQVRI